MQQIRGDWPEGIKRTKQREALLEILAFSTGPMSAQDICFQMGKTGAWLSTVYRILDLFVEKDLVVKTSAMNNQIIVYELNRHKHRHYAVCIKCRKFIPMEDCPIENFIPRLDEKNFRVVGHNLEIYGFCETCAAGPDSAAGRRSAKN
jgi:Fur family ferric uptake transcriptional regulator